MGAYHDRGPRPGPEVMGTSTSRVRALCPWRRCAHTECRSLGHAPAGAGIVVGSAAVPARSAVVPALAGLGPVWSPTSRGLEARHCAKTSSGVGPSPLPRGVLSLSALGRAAERGAHQRRESLWQAWGVSEMVATAAASKVTAVATVMALRQAMPRSVAGSIPAARGSVLRRGQGRCCRRGFLPAMC